MALLDFINELIRSANGAQSGGPSTGLGAPIPQTRWGDTIGSVNARPGTPLPPAAGPDATADPTMTYGARQLPNAIPLPNPNVTGYISPFMFLRDYYGKGPVTSFNSSYQPGIGTGAPNPQMSNDFVYQYPGADSDPLMWLMTRLLNNRFSNELVGPIQEA